ncbi:MAG: CDC48 family AAA ATPase [Bacillota bacterium]|jgi:transitional endoplasmic reticulum ATPase
MPPAEVAPETTTRVTEARPRDVGRGIARLDPGDMSALGVEIGDVIWIEGPKVTVARAMPTYPEDRGRQSLHVDGIIRENAQVSLGEKVRLRRAEWQQAGSVLLKPQGVARGSWGEKEARYLARVLDGVPVVVGDRVRVTLVGTRAHDFLVLDAVPKGALLITADTDVRIKTAAVVSTGTGEPQCAKVTYEDIGGLQREVRKIREMTELPLKYPEVFDKLGIDAPKGVLLYGPPGCGKTLIARAVAGETLARFYAVNGPEIVHKFYGESEAHLRRLFEEASRNAPAVIFLDEIDAVAPKRAEVVGEVEKRIVAQMLALMDGLKTRGKVIVIGATNIPEKLDPALRRPGRFDREIAIGIPDRHARLQILQIHTRGMPLAKDVDLDTLAQITHGFVGADLEALCREAAMITLRKIMPEIDFAQDFISYETLERLALRQADFLEALKEIEPSAIREVFTEVPEVGWADVGSLDEAKQVLQESIEWPLNHEEFFAAAGVRPPKGILLHGPPGCGKTLLAKAVASESQANFIMVKGPSLMSRYVGDSEKGVREVFRKARQAAPCIVFFDEIDALVPVRGAADGDSHVTERVISQFLTELDGIEELKGVVVLAATNRLDIIDPAILRPGRFDILVELPYPDERARLAVLQVHTRGRPLAADICPAAWARATDGFSGAALEGLCRRAATAALRDWIESSGGSITAAGPFVITLAHWREAYRELCRHQGVPSEAGDIG